MPARESRSPQRAATRRRLVEAAVEVVGERGFHSASVEEIARRAGFSIGALYGNFAGKDELFLAVFDAHVAWFDELMEAGAQAADPAQALAAWLDVITEAPDQFLVFVDFWAYAMRRPALEAEFRERMSHMRETVLAIAGQDDGPLRPSAPDEAATLFLAVARGLALEKLADRDAVSERTVRAFFRALRE